MSQTLPQDVYPESGCRLPLPKREELNDYGKAVYDKRVGPGARTLRGLRGPYGILLHSPRLADYFISLNQYLRFETEFSGRIRELIILVAARAMDSRFEWAAHEPEALKEGLPPEIVDVVKHRKEVSGLPETEATIIRLGRELFGGKKVEAETFARALKIFGPRQLVDLVAMLANYAAIAHLLVAFDMQVEPGEELLLPVP